MSSFIPGLSWFSRSSEKERGDTTHTRSGKGRRRTLSEPSSMDVDREEGSRSKCPVCNVANARPYPDTTPIFFYHRGKPFFEFTNFSLHSIEYDGRIYPTAEHLFQALKFVTTNPGLAEQIRTQPSARAARAEAGYHRAQQRADWFEVNIEVMDMVLHAKFTQHDDLRKRLLGTGNRELIEDSPDDVFWGIGRSGEGRNELGKALMRLRGQLLAAY
ncbi:hypothetical protein EDB92DRAFT_1840829 [Lactarius akahatsu]|uniref:NADAR domain-containing protein n=1 Tax=Lactarius akahatsu TaxID=416441 RepID=A0AAD4LN03_9AGAM|nr:hypothetical protein EDB92DRAFT_1840829 [Lactarius akahatsu]